MKTKQKRISSAYYKKGQDINLLFVAVMVLVLAIVIIIGYRLIKQFNYSFQTLQTIPQEAKDITQKLEDNYVARFDILFVFVLVLLWIVMIASAFFIDTHPVFFMVSLILTSVTAFMGGHLANSYAQFKDTPSLSADANQFKIIPYIFQHYIAILMVMGITTAISLFAKIKSIN